MKRWMATLSCVVCACAPSDAAMTEPAAAEPAVAPVALVVTDQGDAPWQLDIALAEPGPVLFSRSNGDYRVGSYTPLTDGARLERLGHFDTLILPDGATQARYAFTPHTAYIQAEYTPFIPFSDGGLALYAGQFELLRADSAQTVAALSDDLSNWSGEYLPVPLTLRSDRTMLIDGQRVEGEADVDIDGNGEYIYFGNAELTEGRSFIGVIDPGLPAWLRDSLDDKLTTIFEALEVRFGFGLSTRATVLFAFGGYDQPGLSNSGGTLPGNVLALETEGQALRNPDPQILRRLQRFLAHEAVHLFQAEVGRIAGRSDLAWIHEGGAEAMSGRLLVEQGLWDKKDRERYLAADFGRCAETLSGHTLAEAIRESRVGAYDCGELIAVASDAALADHDLYDLWTALIKLRGEKDQYEPDDYFDAMASMGADGAWLDRLRALTEDPVEDARRELGALLAEAGLDLVAENGAVTRIMLPRSED